MKFLTKKRKKVIKIYLVLWVLFALVLVLPATVTWVDSFEGGAQLDKFFASILQNILDIGTRVRAFSSEYIDTTKTALQYYSGLYFLWLFITVLGTKEEGSYHDIEHGSSDWCEGGEQYKILSKNEGILLAEKNYLPLDKFGNTNVLIVGGSGSGKSAAYSKPNAFQKLGSYVFTDPKGELYDDTAGYLERNGWKIKVLNLVNPKSSDGYNPLAHIKSELDVDVIAETIVKGQEKGKGSSDPFWDDTATELLKALILYLVATRPPEEQNLASCAAMVRAAAANGGGSSMLNELMEEIPLDHPARIHYNNVMTTTSEKTLGSIYISLQSKLGKFDSQEIANVTSTNTIDFEEIANQKTAVYVISSDTHAAYDFLLTIFFAQMIQQLYDVADKSPGGKLKIPTFFILDEFPNIGQIPDFDKKISTSRSRKISFSVILQNLDQLEAIYDKSYETIMANCDTHLFLGSNSTKTVEYFSKALGEKTIKRNTVTKSKDKQGHKSGTSDSDQIMARALMTPDELRRMDMSDAIIFEKGLKPIKAKKVFYYKTNMIKEFEKYQLDHNHFDPKNRGTWRKFNPYNRDQEYTEQERDLNIESLDDLFEDDEKEKLPEQDQKNKKITKNDLDELLFDDEVKEPNVDLQKELEAKFDELFGE